MSSTGSTPPSPGTNVKDPHEHTDGTLPTDPGKTDVDASVDLKATPPPSSTTSGK